MSENLGRNFDKESQTLFNEVDGLAERLKALKARFPDYDYNTLSDRAFSHVFTVENLDHLKRDVMDIVMGQELEQHRFIQLDRVRAFIEHLKTWFPDVEAELLRNTLRPSINELDTFLSEEFADGPAEKQYGYG